MSSGETVIVFRSEYDIAATTELDLSGKDITDDVVEQIEHLTNLTNLGLWSNQICDITPLGSLTNLTALGLFNNKIHKSEIKRLKEQLTSPF